MTEEKQTPSAAPRQIVGLCGSLRQRSYNGYTLHAAAALLPPGWLFEALRYDAVPLYSQDLEEQTMPAEVTALARRIAAADALLIASPEYNFSISGVLKNLIDWLSRTPQAPFRDKPVALMSATLGPVGGARHQYELRKVLGALEALVMPRPEVFIGRCATKFDGGALTDPEARQALAGQMTAFARWVERLRAAPRPPGG